MPPNAGPSRLPLAVVVLTLNEARHLPECLASAAALGQRTLVLDSGSTDDTVLIARQLGAEVYTRQFDGYANQRNAALDLVEEEWVLFLDADERLTPALRAEIHQAIRDPDTKVAGFWIPRRNWMLGREIHGGGWWPDYQLRLLRRGRARYAPERQVHEIVHVDGQTRRLREPLLHLNYDSMPEFRARQAAYASLRATELAESSVRLRARTFVGQPAREFWRRFVTLRGFRDGELGLKLAATCAWYELQTWRQVARLRRTAKPVPDAPPRLAPPSPAVDISVVIVSYNVRDLLLACLASIDAAQSAGQLKCEIIVVDNASPDGSADVVRRRFPHVTVIDSGGNLGFARAANRGLSVTRGRTIILLNPDSTVVGDAPGTLARWLDEHPAVGVVGPRVLYPDGTPQSTRRRFPTFLTGLLESTILQEWWPDNRVLRRYYVRDRSDMETQAVDWLVGACLAIRREVISDVGFFDERFFLYSEEIEWLFRVRQAGWQVVYLAEATIIHHEGASSQQNIPARQIDFDTSKVLLFECLHGRGAARLLRAFLLATYLLRIALEAGKASVGHKPALRRARVKTYVRAFRSGLQPHQSGR